MPREPSVPAAVRTSRISDVSLALMVSVMNTVQAEVFASGVQAEEIARIPPYCDNSDFANACVDQSFGSIRKIIGRS